MSTTDNKKTYSKEEAEKIIKEYKGFIEDMKEWSKNFKEEQRAVKVQLEYNTEYIDRLTNGEDEEMSAEIFYKEKLDEVCAQISALQSNADTPEKEEELKLLELKKSVLEDTLSEITNKLPL